MHTLFHDGYLKYIHVAASRLCVTLCRKFSSSEWGLNMLGTSPDVQDK